MSEPAGLSILDIVGVKILTLLWTLHGVSLCPNLLIEFMYNAQHNNIFDTAQSDEKV